MPPGPCSQHNRGARNKKVNPTQRLTAQTELI
jgi:hypothetical protein